MKNFYDVADVTTSAVGVGFGINNIYSTLGVILLILSIANILIKAGIAIYNAVKKKQVNKIPKIIDDTIDKLEEVHKDE